MSRPARSGSPGVVLLWTCILLFAARVIAQVEVLLLAPAWLPPMEAWHSGLLPYHLLLPAQIVLLVVMAAVASSISERVNERVSQREGSFAARNPGTATTLRVIAFMYFAFMAGRLVLLIMEHDLEFWRHGAIPVAFHWVLALFLLVTGREAPPPAIESFWMETDDSDEYGEAGTADYGDVPIMAEPLVHGGRFPEELRFGHAR